jgi:transposase InsO family protein
VLNHAGMDRIFTTIKAAFHHPHLRVSIASLLHVCATCQKHKLSGKGYGHLAPREALFQPWYEVATDTIGPWTVKVDGVEFPFYALTMIDTVTNLTELVRMPSTQSQYAVFAMEMGWLLRYPRPVRVVHDNGPKFQEPFRQLLLRYGIDNVPTSVRNPQANAICERMHQVVGDILRTLIHVNPPQNMPSAAAAVDYALSIASHALRATVHKTLGLSPGALVFHRDMLIDLPFVADLLLLRDKRQALIDYNLRRENNARRSFDYQVGQWVLELIPRPTKLGIRTQGPFRVEQVHTNGTVTIRRAPLIIDRVNIRHLRPFFQPQDA